jgi:hypothetical protein
MGESAIERDVRTATKARPSQKDFERTLIIVGRQTAC